MRPAESFINTSTKSLFINTIKDKDFLKHQKGSVRSKSRRSLKPTKSQRAVDTPHSLKHGM